MNDETNMKRAGAFGLSVVTVSHNSYLSMASSRQLQSKRPPAITPARRTISVEEWDAKAPLSDLEVRSVNALKAANEKIPLPLRVCLLMNHLNE